MRCFLLSFCLVALLFNGVAASGAGRNLVQKFSSKVGKVTQVTMVGVCGLLTCAGLLFAHPQHSGESQSDTAVVDSAINGDVTHKDVINLATHTGEISVDRGSLFTLKVPVDFELEDMGDGKHFIPRYRDVQLAILDRDGNPIENALMMWHRGEAQAKMQFMWGKGDWDALRDKVKGVAVFENLFISQPLPAGAQLRVTGMQLSSDKTPDSNTDTDYFFDIATIQGSGLDLSVLGSALGTSADADALEMDPLLYEWRLKYQQALAIGSTIDWYVQVGESVSKIVTNEVGYGAVWGPDNPDAPTDTVIYLSAPYGEGEINKALDDYPDSYFLVTKITTPTAPDKSVAEGTEERVNVPRKTVVAVHRQER